MNNFDVSWTIWWSVNTIDTGLEYTAGGPFNVKKSSYQYRKERWSRGGLTFIVGFPVLVSQRLYIESSSVYWFRMNSPSVRTRKERSCFKMILCIHVKRGLLFKSHICQNQPQCIRLSRDGLIYHNAQYLTWIDCLVSILSYFDKSIGLFLYNNG